MPELFSVFCHSVFYSYEGPLISHKYSTFNTLDALSLILQRMDMAYFCYSGTGEQWQMDLRDSLGELQVHWAALSHRTRWRGIDKKKHLSLTYGLLYTCAQTDHHTHQVQTLIQHTHKVDILLWTSLFICFMCMDILPAYVSAHHLHAWCLGKLEQGLPLWVTHVGAGNQTEVLWSARNNWAISPAPGMDILYRVKIKIQGRETSVKNL